MANILIQKICALLPENLQKTICKSLIIKYLVIKYLAIKPLVIKYLAMITQSLMKIATLLGLTKLPISKALWVHIAVVILLFILQFTLSPYHHASFARIMVLACFAMGYNIAFGYTGMLSLGHALFFGAGMYGMGLLITLFAVPSLLALILGIVIALLVSLIVGLLALRTTGVSFMIVTLMFSQIGYLATLYYGRYTRGDEGFVLTKAQRMVLGLDLSNEHVLYFVALAMFAIILFASYAVIRSPLGRVFSAMRENEDRARMLGYNPFYYKLIALCISGTMAGTAGAVYGLLFGYVGASFVSIQYSILPLLWVLLGGTGTLLGPLLGVIFMFYLIDITSSFFTAYLLLVGLALLILVMRAPDGILGTLRERYYRWLP